MGVFGPTTLPRAPADERLLGHALRLQPCTFNKADPSSVTRGIYRRAPRLSFAIAMPCASLSLLSSHRTLRAAGPEYPSLLARRCAALSPERGNPWLSGMAALSRRCLLLHLGVSHTLRSTLTVSAICHCYASLLCQPSTATHYLALSRPTLTFYQPPPPMFRLG